VADMVQEELRNLSQETSNAACAASRAKQRWRGLQMMDKDNKVGLADGDAEEEPTKMSDFNASKVEKDLPESVQQMCLYVPPGQHSLRVGTSADERSSETAVMSPLQARGVEDPPMHVCDFGLPAPESYLNRAGLPRRLIASAFEDSRLTASDCTGKLREAEVEAVPRPPSHEHMMQHLAPVTEMQQATPRATCAPDLMGPGQPLLATAHVEFAREKWEDHAYTMHHVHGNRTAPSPEHPTARLPRAELARCGARQCRDQSAETVRFNGVSLPTRGITSDDFMPPQHTREGCHTGVDSDCGPIRISGTFETTTDTATFGSANDMSIRIPLTANNLDQHHFTHGMVQSQSHW